MLEPLTRADLRAELEPIQEELRLAREQRQRAEGRFAGLEARLKIVEAHPQNCPVRAAIEDMKARNGLQDEKIVGLQVGVAKMLGYLTGAGAAGGFVVGLILKLTGA